MGQTADVVVIGAGFAGAATAYHLTQMGVTDVVVLEAESLPGTHSSGRNAAMARFLVLKPDHLPLAVEGIRFLHEPPGDFPAREYVRRCGSMMLVQEGEKPAIDRAIATWRGLGIPAEWLTREEVERRVSATIGGTFVGAVYCREDGVADIAALLDSYLRVARSRGARLLTGRSVQAIGVKGGRVAWVDTDQERIHTHVVVNASGAWASGVGRMAGATDVPLRSLRRHLVVSSPLSWVDTSWPFVWDVSHELYFRPEPPGLLLSPGDAAEVGPGDVPVDRSAIELLAEKIERWMPRLSGISVGSVMAGARTFTPDGNFVIGRDPVLPGFVWCAGLGGNGMALSSAIGRLTAGAVAGSPAVAAHSPERFA
jgi:D-arginine dehydrogenase